MAAGSGCTRRVSVVENCAHRGAVRLRRSILSAVTLGCLLGLFPRPAATQEQRPFAAQLVETAGTADAQARAQAQRAIPYRRLTPEAAAKIRSVVSQPTVFRRLPVTTIDCDPNLLVFLLRNPEVVVNIWELMGITQIELQRRGPFHFAAHDGMGTVSQIELVYGTGTEHLYFGRGVYEGSLLKNKVYGECVMLLRSGTFTGPDGRSKVRNVLDVFLKLDSPTLDLVVRTCQPLFVKAADNNFVETANFLRKLSRTAELNPTGVGELAGRLTQVQPQVRSDFAELVNQVATAAHSNRVAGRSAREVAPRMSLVSTRDTAAVHISRRTAEPPHLLR